MLAAVYFSTVIAFYSERQACVTLATPRRYSLADDRVLRSQYVSSSIVLLGCEGEISSQPRVREGALLRTAIRMMVKKKPHLGKNGKSTSEFYLL